MPVQSQHRNRSSSNPFSDPSLSNTASKTGPPVPPKVPSKRPPHQRNNTMEALQDTVTLRNQDQNPRNRVGRSQTQLTQQVSSNGRSQAHTPRRSLSHDSATRVPVEKGKSSKKSGKKGSMHADVIDRLDFSGVGPMFHHDGPFDACAPSRNRNYTRAPMAAWSVAPDGTPIHNPEVKAQPIVKTYMTEPTPRKNVDAIAEAWGIHEPEPFEDFSAGGGHSNDYRQHYSPSTTISKKSNHDDSQQSARRQPTRKTLVPPPQPIFVPAPEEDISIPVSPVSGSPGAGMKRSRSLMHRIRKMRETPNVPVNHADAPADEYASPPSPGAARPTHRSQNSFLGRFGRVANGNGNGREYTGSPTADNEPYVYVDVHKDKQLPKPPLGSSGASSENGVDGYFDSNHGSAGESHGGGGGGGGGGLGRRRSLLQKVGKVVKGQK